MKKTKSKLQDYIGKMKTMEEELRQKNKELDNTKAEISLVNKKNESKQTDESAHQHAKTATTKEIKETDQATRDLTYSSDQQKQKTVLLEQKVSQF